MSPAHVPPPLPSPLSRTDTITHKGFKVPDPFAPRRRPGASFVHALLATALFRCWHILLFFAGWSSLITVLNHQGHNIVIQTTLLTVLGTVLGFVISYRTTASFERYNEGRKLWSQIIIANRSLSRLIWFHVQEEKGGTQVETDELKARTLVEKKSVINLLEAFAVAVKHYLRGEDGIYYKDLYYLVKFLPAYALPAGMPSQLDLTNMETDPKSPDGDEENAMNALDQPFEGSQIHNRRNTPHITLPEQLTSPTKSEQVSGKRTSFAQTPRSATSFLQEKQTRGIIPLAEEDHLFPASMPPKYTIFDLFPFSLLVRAITKSGHAVKGKKAQRIRAQMLQKTISHNLPLEISLYLSSYVASVQDRKLADVPTLNSLLGGLSQLIDSLGGLERILTTPVPFSYSIHLWVTTIIYCLALPLQIYESMGWITIPANIIVSFIFFGFLVAGEEIENPFGYDKNDLNLDHFTSNIIRNELKAVTSTPPPNPRHWAFVPENNLLFPEDLDDRVTPEEWVARGPRAIQQSLSHSAF